MSCYNENLQIFLIIGKKLGQTIEILGNIGKYWEILGKRVDLQKDLMGFQRGRG